jgi:hypothetical protein
LSALLEKLLEIQDGWQKMCMVDDKRKWHEQLPRPGNLIWITYPRSRDWMVSLLWSTQKQ